MQFFESLRALYGNVDGKIAALEGYDARQNDSFFENIPLPKLQKFSDYDQHAATPTSFEAFRGYVAWVPFEKRGAGLPADFQINGPEGVGADPFQALDFSNYFIALAPPPPGYAGPMTYEALTKAGVPLFAYGNFLTVAVNFLILAFIIFMMVRQINRIRRSVPPVTVLPEDTALLREIRDSLRR